MDCTISTITTGRPWRRLSQGEIATLLPHVADLESDEEAVLSLMARMLGVAPPLDDAAADAIVVEVAHQIRADADAILAAVAPAGHA